MDKIALAVISPALKYGLRQIEASEKKDTDPQVANAYVFLKHIEEKLSKEEEFTPVEAEIIIKFVKSYETHLQKTFEFFSNTYKEKTIPALEKITGKTSS